MINRLIILLLLHCTASAQQKITLLVGKVQHNTTLVDNAIIADAPGEMSGYPAFGYGFQLSSNGWVINGHKKSDNHAAQGDFAVNISDQGGPNFTVHYVRYDDEIVQTSQGTFYYDEVNSYLYALTIDANLSGNSPSFLKIETYRISEAAFTANPDDNWEKTNTVDFTGYASGMVIGDLWGDVLQLPSGKLLVPVHLRHTSTQRHIAIFLESTDAGESWSIGSTILDKVGGGSFPNGSFSEVNPVITEYGASDATTKIVVLLRNESYGYWTHVRSSNGGSSWTEDVTNAFGYPFDNWGGICAHGSPALIPISSKLHSDGYVYSAIGYRGYTPPTNHAAVVLLKLSVSDFYNNTYNPASASTSFIVPESNCYINTTNGDLIHFGYIMLFKGLDGHLWGHYYDQHDPQSEWLNGDIKTTLIQVKITTAL